MNTERTEKFVNAIACDLEEGGFRQVSGTTLRRTLATAVSAALPLLAEQQGVRVQRWGMGPYPHSPDIGMLRDPEGRYVLFTDHERVVAELQAALAATGKQQVGEQKPYAPEGYSIIADHNLVSLRRRAEIPTRIERGEVWYWQGNGEDFPESLSCPVIMHADTLRALLAARQPGAQVPVAYWLAVDKDGVVEFGMSADDANGGQASRQEVNDFINGPLHEGGVPHRLVGVYAAPPAQGIDLGPLVAELAAADSEYAEAKKRYHTVSAMSGAAGGRASCRVAYEREVTAKRRFDAAVRALIDQRDAAPGVSRG